MIYIIEIVAHSCVEIDANDDADAFAKLCIVCAEAFAGLPDDTFVSVVDERGERWGAALSHYRYPND